MKLKSSEPLSNWDNLPAHALAKTLDRKGSKSSNIRYAKRHHIKLRTRFPAAVKKCAIPDGDKMNLTELKNMAKSMGVPTSDSFGALSRYELCNSLIGKNVKKVMPTKTSTKIVSNVRKAVDQAMDAKIVSDQAVAKNPMDSALQSAAIVSSQLVDATQQAADKVMDLVQAGNLDQANALSNATIDVANASTNVVDSVKNDTKAIEQNGDVLQTTEQVKIAEDVAQDAIAKVEKLIFDDDLSLFNLADSEIQSSDKNCYNLKKYNHLESGQPISVKQFRDLYDSDEVMTRDEIKKCLQNSNISYRSKANDELDYDSSLLDMTEYEKLKNEYEEEGFDFSKPAYALPDWYGGRRVGRKSKKRNSCKKSKNHMRNKKGQFCKKSQRK